MKFLLATITLIWIQMILMWNMRFIFPKRHFTCHRILNVSDLKLRAPVT